jgi:hypothetical protein
MSFKTYVQIFLIILTISITVLFFIKYFYNDENSTAIISEKTIEKEIILNKNIENIIEDLKFENIDIYGNKFVINAKYGEIRVNHPDVLMLKIVTGTIYFTNKPPINIASNFAKYNKLNFDTIFYENVKITYENNLIRGDNLNISLDKSVASINGNVIINNNYMESYADNIDLNLLNRDIIINMFDKEDNIKINRK